MKKLTKAEEILELHLGSDFYLLQESEFYRNIKNAMNEAINSTHCCKELCDCKKHSIKTNYGFELCTKCGNEFND